MHNFEKWSKFENFSLAKFLLNLGKVFSTNSVADQLFSIQKLKFKVENVSITIGGVN